MSKYSRALGLDSGHTVSTQLSLSGAGAWLVSKVPAAVGGLIAKQVYDWAAAKWPSNKYSREFVGSIGVVVAAYGVQALVSATSPSSSHMLDKLTDGMIGNVSGVVWGLTKKLFANSAGVANSGGASSAVTLDGDRQAVIDVGDMLASSPETTSAMAAMITDIMRKEGHEVDDAAAKGLVDSLREASSRLAKGKF